MTVGVILEWLWLIVRTRSPNGTQKVERRRGDVGVVEQQQRGSLVWSDLGVFAQEGAFNVDLNVPNALQRGRSTSPHQINKEMTDAKLHKAGRQTLHKYV